MIRPAERPDGERAFQLLDPTRHFAAAPLDNDEETSLDHRNMQAEADYDLARDAMSAG